MELAIFVGLQGAGKSTFYRHHLAETHEHVSKDAMRSARDKNARQLALLEDALRRGRSVALDNTNARAADRAAAIAVARRFGARVIAYWFDVDAKVCLSRNDLRTGRARVPPVAIHATARRLEPPRESEGFDEVRVVR